MNNIITEADFRKQIKKCAPGGYLFFGDEDYLKSFSLNSLRASVCPDPSLAPFNDIRLDPQGLTPEALLGALSTLPMMSETKLVEVSGMNFREVKGKLLDSFCEVFSSLPEFDYNILVISVPADAIDEGYLPKRPSATLKKLSEHLTPVRFEKSSPAMLARWVGRHFEANGVAADPMLCRRLVDYCGTDMYRLSSETDKLSWYTLAAGKTSASPADIERVNIADTDYDSFAFANAVMENRSADALRILAEMKRRRIEPTAIMGEIISTFCMMHSVRLLTDGGISKGEISKRLKIHEFRVGLCQRNGAGIERLRRALDLCADADAAIKLSPQGYTAIERLICAL